MKQLKKLHKFLINLKDEESVHFTIFFILQSCPDSTMKKNVNKISNEFEKMLNEEFQSKWDSKSKSQDVVESQNNNNKKDEKDSDNNTADAKHEDTKKNDPKTSVDDKI